MADIVMSPELMQQRSKEYAEEAAKLTEIISNMDKIKKQLESEWQGQSRIKFIAVVDEITPSFVKARDLIVDMNKAVDNIKNTMVEVDNAISQALNAI
ncbi:MAG: WXG100 family type VII secretion target [Coriobacteriia bacterium]|nr:WXG100 family type VII secretion target [Coriobacteriia bacterium]